MMKKKKLTEKQIYFENMTMKAYADKECKINSRYTPLYAIAVKCDTLEQALEVANNIGKYHSDDWEDMDLDHFKRFICEGWYSICADGIIQWAEESGDWSDYRKNGLRVDDYATYQ